MRIFRFRPLALFGCVTAVFAVLGKSMSGRVKMTVCAVSACLFLLVLLVRAPRRSRSFCRMSAAILAGIVLSLGSSYLFFNIRYASVEPLYGKTEIAEGVVLDRRSDSVVSVVLDVSLDRLAGVSCNDRAVLTCTYPSGLQAGDRFRAAVTVRPFATDGGYDEETILLSDGCTVAMTCSDAADCEIFPDAAAGDLRVILKNWNLRLSHRLRTSVGGDAGGLASALLCGNRDWIDGESNLEFRRAGVSHLLALSGLHVSILLGALELLLRLLRIPKRVRAGLIPVAGFAFYAVTGCSVSTLRAVLMVTVLYLGFFLRADYDPFTSISAVLAAILIVTPYAVADLSLWLSFLAAGSIIVFSPLFREFSVRLFGFMEDHPRAARLLRTGFEGICIGTVANAALMLLMSRVFGEVSLASIPATLLLSPLLTLLLVSAAVTLILPFTAPVTAFLARVMLAVVSFFSDLPHVLIPVVSRSEQILLIVLTGILILLAVLPIKRKAWFLSVPALMIVTVILSFCLTAGAGAREVSFPSGNGEYSLTSAHGHAVLTDHTVGTLSATYPVTADALRNSRCTELDELILTRYYNSETHLIESLSDRVPIRLLRIPIPENARDAAIASRLSEVANARGIPVVFGE